MTSSVKNIYIDGLECENNAGVLSFAMHDQIEVRQEDLVAFADDFTISGNVSSVSAASNRL